MSRLRIARGFALPVDVAGEAIAILAKRGAGKTNTGRVLVEELHGARVQTVVLDPVGAWWGLRSSADGGKDGLPLPVLGGAHGDVPLQAAAGALLANVVVDTGQSLVLDLSDFSKTEQRRFVTDFAERLYTRKARDRTLLHLVLEEADEFAPQRVSAGDARMVGSIEQLVRRGRGRGIGLTMITQRSASLNKSVLEQTDVLIIMRTTGPRDRAAVEAWVAKQDVDGAEDVLPSLSGLETGEAWIWNPERGLLERVRIRLAHTFDSSSTPKAGERRVEPAAAAAIDLTKLGAEIEATAERAKENDPSELRRRVRRLEDELKKKRSPPQDERVAELEAEVERVTAIAADLDRELGAAIEWRQTAHGKVATDLLDKLHALQEESMAALFAANDEVQQRATGLLTGETRLPAMADRDRVPRPAPAPRNAPPKPADSARSVRPPAPAADHDGRVSGPQQRILDALAALEAIGISDAHKTQLALFAQASPKSSSYSNNLGALRTAGLIDYPAGGRVHLTPDGRAVADGSAAPSSTEELHRFVYDLVGGSKARLLEQLVAHYPGALEKGQLAELAGASATSSSFSNNLGSLRSLGLIDYPRPGEIAALPVLFLEERA